MGGRGEREAEEDHCARKPQTVASCVPPTKDLALNQACVLTGNQIFDHFGLWDDAQPTEPHHSGPKLSSNLIPAFTMYVLTVFLVFKIMSFNHYIKSNV